jgi:hypothetical protein
MAETQEHGALFFFATDEPPTVAAIDDIYLTVTTAVPNFPDKVEAIDIVLSVEYAQGGHRPALDRPHRVAPLQGMLIGFTLFDRRRNRDA